MIFLNTMKIFLIIFLVIFPLLSSQAGPLTNDQARTYREEGYRLQSLGDIDGALQHYQKAVQIDPNFAEVYNDLGVIYESLGDNLKSLEMYEKSLEINPKNLSVYTNLAFLYEKKGDARNAIKYWRKRYELGQEGDYWREVSKQHLLKLNALPEMRREMLEKQASEMSKKLVYKREQEQLKIVEEAQLRYEVGYKAFIERDYEIAIQEFRTVLSLKTPDQELEAKAREFYKKSQNLQLKKQALVNTQNALDYINNGDYLSAGDKLKSALTAVFRIIQ